MTFALRRAHSVFGGSFNTDIIVNAFAATSALLFGIALVS